MELLNQWKLWLQKTFLCTFLRPDTHYDEADVRPNVANIQVNFVFFVYFWIGDILKILRGLTF